MAPDPVVEAGLHALKAEAPPAVPGYRHGLAKRVSADLAVGKTRDALGTLASPGRLTTKADIDQLMNDRFKPDEMTGVPPVLTLSARQVDRVDKTKKAGDVALRLSEIGVAGLTPVERDVVVARLGKVLAVHPVWMAQHPGFDYTTAAGEADILKALNNDTLRPILKDALTSQAATASPDYKPLQDALVKQQALTDQIATLDAEIVTLEGALVVKQGESKHFKRDVDAATGAMDLGASEKAWQAAQVNRDTKAALVSKHDTAITQARDILTRARRGGGGYPLALQDTVAGAIVPIADLPALEGFIAGNVAAMQAAADVLRSEIAKHDIEIRIYREKKDALGTDIPQTEQEIAAKKAEKAQMEAQKAGVDADVATKQAAIRTVDEAMVAGMEGVVNDAFFQLWSEYQVAASSGETGFLNEQKAAAQAKLLEAVRAEYIDGKGNIDKGKLKGLVKKLVQKEETTWPPSKGMNHETIRRLLTMDAAARASGNTELSGAINKILSDPALVKELSSAMTLDVFKIAAIKDPKSLEGIVGEDDVILAGIRDNVLPGLIDQAIAGSNDPALKAQLEKFKKPGSADSLKSFLAIIAVILAALGIVVVASGA